MPRVRCGFLPGVFPEAFIQNCNKNCRAWTWQSYALESPSSLPLKSQRYCMQAFLEKGKAMKAHDDEAVAAILKPPVSEKRTPLLVVVFLMLALAAPIYFFLTLAGCSSATSDKPDYSYESGTMKVQGSAA